MTAIEKEIENKLTEMVKRHGGLCLKWVCPGWAGVPDRIILLPEGRIIFCELKRPKGGKLRLLQTWWRKRLQAFGFLSVIIKNAEEVEQLAQIIEEWTGGENERTF